jgi:uncharacterized repeat protein (TIGR01451 family)
MQLMRCGTGGNSLAMRRLVPKLSAMVLAGLSLYSLADEAPQTITELVAEVREEVPVAPGRSIVRYHPATAIVQGQTVFYTVRIHNPTPVPARDVVTVQRIPVNTSYVEGSAAGPGADISFSADGGQSFASQNELRITDTNGAARRPAAAEYTHIRWRLRNALAPGATALARFQAVFR